MSKTNSRPTIMTTTLSIALTLGLASIAQADTLTLSVETADATGSIRAAVYASAEAFDKQELIAAVSQPTALGTTQLKIPDLEPGTYGIALYQDVNNNMSLDRNLFGAPSEPFGFSQNPIIKFSAPKFEEFQFEFDGTPMALNITLNGG